MTRRSATQSPGLEPSGSPCVSTASPREKSGEAQGYLSERVTWRLGRYQDVLDDVMCDAVITDPPYSDRNHKGYNRGVTGVQHSGDDGGRHGEAAGHNRTAIDYQHWTADDVMEFVRFWHGRTRGWIAAMTSHDLIPAWEAAHASVGRYCFAPIPCVISGMSVRLMGDGPSSEAVYLVVARPKRKEFLKWGTLPGHYEATRTTGGGGRGKPLDLMRAIVRDYSRPGALVCDPCGGLATTGVAALGVGRRFVGAEMDEPTYRRGRESLQAVVPVELFDPGRATQVGLFDEAASR